MCYYLLSFKYINDQYQYINQYLDHCEASSHINTFIAVFVVVHLGPEYQY